MGEYGFFVAYLRFVVAKTATSSPEIAAMFTELDRIADALEAGYEIKISFDKLNIVARGMAGVAGFLQEQILPEAVTAGNKAGERQIRWVIDTSMRLMTKLASRAELGGNDEPFVLSLPAAPSDN